MSRAPVETGEELRQIKDYMLYPVLLDVLERDRNAIGSLPLKMTKVYMQSLRLIQDEINGDLVRLRQTLRQNGIRIYHMQRTRDGIETRYLCRGYHHDFTMLWSLIKTEVEKKLSRYFGIDAERGTRLAQTARQHREHHSNPKNSTSVPDR